MFEVSSYSPTSHIKVVNLLGLLVFLPFLFSFSFFEKNYKFINGFISFCFPSYKLLIYTTQRKSFTHV